MKKKLKNSTMGFTLVELLVTITILGLLTIIALPQVNNLMNSNNKAKYEKYAESMLTSGKLYTDSNSDDMFGNNTSGCYDISYSELKGKDLIKDIKIGDITCSTENSFVRVIKSNDHYIYESSIKCVDKSGKTVYQKALSKDACDGTKPDDEPPKISISPNGLPWQTGAGKKVQISVSDAYGLIENAKIKYAWTTTPSSVDESSYKEYNFKNNRYEGTTDRPKTLAIDIPQGASAIYYLIVKPVDVRDANGNYQTASITSEPYKLDNIAPLCTLVLSGNTMTGFYSDAGGSDVAYYGYSPTYSGTSVLTKTVTTAGTTNFYVRDNAGNKGNCTMYTITYNANGATNPPLTLIQGKPKNVSLGLSGDKPTRTGYTFQGWGTSASATTPTYQPNDIYLENKGIELFAIWKINTYTVSYDANGGSGAPGTQTKTYGANLTLSSTKPTRTGYTFQGWGTSASATTPTYQPGSTYTTDSNIKLYAIWKINTYTISYDANGGSGAPSSQTKTYGVNLTLSSTKPTRTGHTFQGWGTSAGATTVAYNPGSVYTTNSNVKLYAVWKINTYTVSYDANGGSGAPGAQTKKYDVNLTLSSTKPAKAGHTFQGWGTSAGATTVAYNPGSVYTSNLNIKLYAIWKINTYRVSYNANGGSGAPGAQTKTYGVNLTLSGTRPTRTGHTFQGWGTSAGTTTVAYNPGSTYISNSNITLYAIWKANTYTVSYNANGGSGAPGAQTKTYGVNLTLSNAKPTRSGYNFQGWGTSAGATTVTYNPGSTYTSNSSITLYAIWAAAYEDVWVDVTSESVLDYTNGSPNPSWMDIRLKVTWKEQFNAYRNASRIVITKMQMTSPEWITNFYLGGGKNVNDKGIYVNNSLILRMNYFEGTHGCYAGNGWFTVNAEGSNKGYPWISNEIARGSGGNASIPIRLYLTVTNKAGDHYASFDETKYVTIIGKR